MRGGGRGAGAEGSTTPMGATHDAVASTPLSAQAEVSLSVDTGNASGVEDVFRGRGRGRGKGASGRHDYIKAGRQPTRSHDAVRLGNSAGKNRGSSVNSGGHSSRDGGGRGRT